MSILYCLLIWTYSTYNYLILYISFQIFVDTDSDIRLARRLKRDISQRGRDIHGVMQQYEKFVKPAFDFYIAPSMQHADIIVPRGGENEVRNVFL